MNMPNLSCSTGVDIIAVDYQNTAQAQDLLGLLNAYAQDPMGGGTALSDDCQQHLISKLKNLPIAYSWLAYQDGRAVGLLNAFLGFSTFACQPLLNIHDVFVQPQARGLSISKQLFLAAEQKANQLDCCKVTLEVLTGNCHAKAVYRAFGYDNYQLDVHTGTAEFWQKYLI